MASHDEMYHEASIDALLARANGTTSTQILDYSQLIVAVAGGKYRNIEEALLGLHRHKREGARPPCQRPDSDHDYRVQQPAEGSTTGWPELEDLRTQFDSKFLTHEERRDVEMTEDYIEVCLVDQMRKDDLWLGLRHITRFCDCYFKVHVGALIHLYRKALGLM